MSTWIALSWSVVAVVGAVEVWGIGFCAVLLYRDLREFRPPRARLPRARTLPRSP